MRLLIMISLIGSVFILSSCTHSIMRGSVVMKSNNRLAHVCLGDNEVREGDRVAFYSGYCDETDLERVDGSYGSEEWGSSIRVNCSKRRLGYGSVKKVLNSHFSIVLLDRGVNVSEGTIVEKD